MGMTDRMWTRHSALLWGGGEYCGFRSHGSEAGDQGAGAPRSRSLRAPRPTSGPRARLSFRNLKDQRLGVRLPQPASRSRCQRA